MDLWILLDGDPAIARLLSLDPSKFHDHLHGQNSVRRYRSC